MKQIRFLLSSIRTIEFNVFDDVIRSSKIQQYESTGGFAVSGNIQQHVLTVTVNSDFTCKDSCALSIKVSVDFLIEEDSWNESASNGKAVFPMQFVQHVCGLAISATRGVLAAKTEDFPKGQFILPLIMVGDIIKDDLVIALE